MVSDSITSLVTLAAITASWVAGESHCQNGLHILSFGLSLMASGFSTGLSPSSSSSESSSPSLLAMATVKCVSRVVVHPTGFELGLGGGSSLVARWRFTGRGGGECSPEVVEVGEEEARFTGADWADEAAAAAAAAITGLLRLEERCERSRWLTATSTPGEERRKEAASCAHEE